MPCALCGRDVPGLTRHHLAPRRLHRWYLKRRARTREQLAATVDLCWACHDHIHTHFTERELAERYDAIDKLLEVESVRRFAEWAGRQSSQSLRLSRSGRRRGE